MSKLISEEILPKDKRASATKEEVLSCLEALEEVSRRIFDDPLFRMYRSNVKQIESLCDSLDTLTIEISSEEKDFDRWLKYVEKGKVIGEGIKWFKENSEMNKLISEEDKNRGSANLWDDSE